MGRASDGLVGRGEELAFLRGWLADARAGSGRLVLICGPAGIGKTRLVEELVAAGGPLPTGWGSALADSGTPPLWPWTRALRGFPQPRTALAALVAGDARGEYSAADDAAAATFTADTAVLDALEEQAATTGLLLVLDDLQWADGATLRLLERLATDIRRLPMLVVATHRDAGSDALGGLMLRPGTEILSLHPLTTQEAETLLSAGVDGADPAAVRQAAARSGGSPLYLRTLTRVGAEQLRGHPAGTAASDAPEFRQLVAAALRTAGAEVAAAVEAVSVVGTGAPSWLVAQLLELEATDDVVALLRPAVPAGLLLLAPEESNTDIRFAHALVRDVVYASLPPTRRRELHRRAAEALSPLAIGRDEWAGAVATHWERAGRVDRAVEWAVRAADAARAAAAYDDASRYLLSALRAIDPIAHRVGDAVADLDRAELLLDLARVQYLGGSLEASVESCEQAATEGERAGRPDVIARAAIIVQGVGHPAINLRLERLCRRALERNEAGGSLHLQARVEAQLACTLYESDGFDEAGRWSAAALTHAAASGDPDAELDAIRARAALVSVPGFSQEMLELGRRAAQLAGPTRRPLAELWGQVWRSDSAIHLGNLAEALRELDDMRALADRTGLPLVRWHWLRRVASFSALTGDFVRCRQSADEAAAVASDWHDDSVHGTHLGMFVSLARLRGDPADLPADWTELIPNISHVLPVGRAVLAAGLALVGRWAEASAIYQPLIAAASELRGTNVAALPYLIEMAVAANDGTGCRALRTVLSERFGSTLVLGAGTVFFMGSVARMIGELDVVCGDYELAVAHLEQGLAVDSGLGARPFVARGHLALARAVWAVGDRRRAVDLARQAADEAGRLDMPGLVRQADAVLADLGAVDRPPPALTAREWEIAQLVGQAMSNKEVANRLVLSERTVESHVRNILAKAGLRSRTELTRWMLQQPTRH